MLLATLFIFVFSSFLAGQQKEEKKVIIKKKSTGGWLGVQIQSVNTRIAEKYALKDEAGVLITKVEKESPAEKAGLKNNDVLLEYDGKILKDADGLIEQVQKSKPGDKVKLVILRDKDKKNITAVIGEKPKHMENNFNFSQNFPKGFPFTTHMNRAKIGVELIELNPELGEYFGSPTKKGMLVKKVQKDSPGDKAGIKPGDVIVGIGKESVEDLHDITSAMKDYKKGEKAELSIIRKGAEMKIPVEIEINDSTNSDESKMMFFHDHDGNDIEINLEGLHDELKMIGPQIRTMIKKMKIEGLDNECKNINIELEKIKPELDKAMKEIRIKIKDINTDEIKAEIDKMKPEIEKMKKEIKRKVVIIRAA